MEGAQMKIGRTKDRLYESNDSLEMLKGSASLSMLRWFDDVVETLERLCQKLGFSGGDGYKSTHQQYALAIIVSPRYRVGGLDTIPEDRHRCR
jgi:hypothetical protein